MAIAEAYTGTATISTTPYSLVNNSTTLASVTTDGVYQVYIDASTMATGDEYEILIKEKVTSAGTQHEIYHAHLDSAQSSPWVSPSLILMHGWDVVVTKVAGTDRSISWSIRQVA